jgi:hypothetical protein
MPLKMNCPHCGKTLNVVEKAYGKVLPCPGCNKPVSIPNPSATSCNPQPVQRQLPRVSEEAPATVLPPPSLPTEAQCVLPASCTEPAAATRVCEWCAESIPRQALKCPRCTRWRGDIAMDIQNQYAGLIGAAICAIMAGPFIGLGFGERVVDGNGLDRIKQHLGRSGARG